MRWRASVRRALRLAGRLLVLIVALRVVLTAVRREDESKISDPVPRDDIDVQRGRTWTPPRRRTRLLVGSLAATIGILFIADGTTLARLSGQTAANADQFTAGTVSFSSIAGVTCTANSGAIPGQALNTCQLSVTYSGTASGYVGLDILVVTDSGVGGTPLYTANSGGMTFTVSDGTHAFTIPTTSFTGAPCTALGGDANATCYQTKDELTAVTSPAGDAGRKTWVNGDAATFTLTPSFAVATAGTTSGGTATVSLTAHATQTTDNGSIGSCTVGHECDTTSPGAGTPSWS